MLLRLKNICLYGIGIIIISSNVINYFYAYKYLNDITLQWRIAMYSIALVLFLFSFHLLLTEIRGKIKSLKLVFILWMTMYLLINLIGVCLGYNLHSKGFIAILFSITLVGMANIFIRLWQKYY